MRQQRTARRRRGFARRPRRGITLIELIIAMTILSVGLLSIVGTSAVMARLLGEARLTNLAAIHAETRFEKISGTACTSLTLGTTQSEEIRGITEHWTITDGGNATRLVKDSVSWKSRNSTRSQVFTTLIPCRPGA